MNSSSHQSSQGGWVVSYTQSDVDTIREQIEQAQSARRRWLVLALIIVLAALVGAVALLITSYALYSKSESEKKKLSDENNSLKATKAQQEQQLDAFNAKEQKAAQDRADAETQMDKMRSSVSLSAASDADISQIAQRISGLPQGRIELDEKPPDKLFRRYWNLKTDAGTETYALIQGGPIDNKWFVYSCLVRRMNPGAQ